VYVNSLGFLDASARCAIEKRNEEARAFHGRFVHRGHRASV
jgi:hypothetical protein